MIEAEHLDHLRIVAKDGGRLSAEDCERIGEVADDCEHTHRLLLATQQMLVQANGQRIALNERLIAVIRQHAADLAELRAELHRWHVM